MINIEEANKKSKEVVDAAVKNYAEVTKGFQSIAAEATEYSKKSVQELTSFVEQLTAARSIEAVIELQTKYAKNSYESFVAEATKIGELYIDLAKTAYKPFEASVTKATKVSVVPAA